MYAMPYARRHRTEADRSGAPAAGHLELLHLLALTRITRSRLHVYITNVLTVLTVLTTND